MAYDGSHLTSSRHFDLKTPACVIVSGAGPNVCGHALLHAGGFYFHIAGVNTYPKYMDEAGYERYLKENEKTELGRYTRYMSKPDAALTGLLELMSEKWLWGILPHNCIAFVEDVMQTGGATNFGIYSNCPTMLINKIDWQNTVEKIKRSTTDEAIIWYMMHLSGY